MALGILQYTDEDSCLGLQEVHRQTRPSALGVAELPGRDYSPSPCAACTMQAGPARIDWLKFAPAESSDVNGLRRTSSTPEEPPASGIQRKAALSPAGTRQNHASENPYAILWLPLNTLMRRETRLLNVIRCLRDARLSRAFRALEPKG